MGSPQRAQVALRHEETAASYVDESPGRLRTLDDGDEDQRDR